ncbi:MULTISPECIES: acetoin dehydrogenase dihydrolipoyllysine-residue acetyltransferase subunit [unclassified Burkholderia]|uniref:acetoin dehydrogenase dihydrolipoyllysine-residue acetyltransferase subunit n=1 Tax=unclassified Burkholderia TaxID=2613784 RepID=UPI002AAF57B6|nr:MULTISPECIES: acetoin dehydrogenase dihydrolipoyllysine-residue acetyltransferase subunit [unclassified Burkholderia]
MATEVILPRVDMDMTEGTITAWYVKDGDTIRQGEPIFDIETSKATMEVEAPASGTVRQITASVGDTVPVGTVIAWIYANGETVIEQDVGTTALGVAEPDAAAEPPIHRRADVADAALPGDISDSRIRATPAARRAARESEIDLGSLQGSGPHGRIIENDVRAVAAGRGGSREVVAGASQQGALNRVWLQRGGPATLVFLHGFGAEANSWRPFFNALRDAGLAKNLDVLSIDLPGHGKSPADAAASLENIVDAIGATLAAEDVAHCHLVGHSFGGAIAIALSASRHVRVSSLTLASPAGLGTECNGAFLRGLTQAADRTSLMRWLRELVARPGVIDDAFIATAEQQLSSEAKRVTLASIVDTFFPGGRQKIDLREVIASLTMPVRVVWGASDKIIPMTHTNGLPGRIAQHRFADIGHLPHVEALADVVGIVGEQLSR